VAATWRALGKLPPSREEEEPGTGSESRECAARLPPAAAPCWKRAAISAFSSVSNNAVWRTGAWRVTRNWKELASESYLARWTGRLHAAGE